MKALGTWSPAPYLTATAVEREEPRWLVTVYSRCRATRNERASQILKVACVREAVPFRHGLSSDVPAGLTRAATGLVVRGRPRVRDGSSRPAPRFRRFEWASRIIAQFGSRRITWSGWIRKLPVNPARWAASQFPPADITATPRQISKAGDHMLRHLLYEAPSALMTRCRQPSKLRAWGVAIARRRGAKRARVAVARELAVIKRDKADSVAV
jgi:hypothetical protein